MVSIFHKLVLLNLNRREYKHYPEVISELFGARMASKLTKTPVKGGQVNRDRKTGHLITVSSAKGVTKASPKSRSAVKAASVKRSAALMRLANR